MPEYLKGNYKGPQIKEDKAMAPEDANGLRGEFEKAALEKLGGSIAFVMKSKTFLWTPDADPKKSAKSE
jgi:hypothetical protein